MQLLRNLCFLVALGSMVVTVLSRCNSCQENGLSCVNETHFKVCFDNVQSNDAVLFCGNGKVCTDLGVGCIEHVDGVSPSCSSASNVNCKGCDGSSMFACTSRTTFVMCNGEEEGDQVLTCPESTICDINSGKYCVSECEVTSLECDRAAA